MKKNIHPKYRKVLFVDSTTGRKYLIGTTLDPKGKETYQGQEYPVCHVSISASSHPFFVGGQQFVDTEGRVDKFNKRYQAAQKRQEVVAEQQESAKIQAASKAKKEPKRSKK